MKKALLAMFGLFILCSQVEARDNDWGTAGGIGAEKLWRSTSTCANQTLAKIATGSIVIWSVEIASPGVNSRVWFEHWTSTVDNTSVANMHRFSVFGDTFPYSPTPATPEGYFTTANNQTGRVYVMKQSTMGWIYSTAGAVPACIDIKWDYIEAPNR